MESKMFTQPNNPLVICPFDKSHLILRSRIHYHLIKCSKNHPNCNKVICPYDATEYIDPDEFPKHLFECKSKISIDGLVYANDKMFKNKEHGDIAKTPFHYPDLKEPDEDWAGGLPMLPDYNRHKIGGTWNSSLTNQPQKLSTKGRGSILKKHLEQMNNRCDGLYCTKSCCPKNTQSIAIGRGAMLKKYLNIVVDSKPIGRGALLKIYSDKISESKTPGINRHNGRVDSLKQTADDDNQKYELQ